MGAQEAPGLDVALEPQGAFSGPSELQKDQPTPQPSQTDSSPAWQAELANRVQEYRHRRARLRGDEKGGDETPDFDFGSPGSGLETARPNLIEFPSAKATEQRARPAPDSHSDFPVFGLKDFEIPAQDQASEVNSTTRVNEERRGETGPLEIELGPSLRNSIAGLGEGEPSAVPIAPMSMRIFAGAIDALVLLSGAVVYALISWRVSGHLSLQPLELAAATVATVFFILLYFGGCTALASATPGMIWAGLEVCTFEGGSPSLSDCLWRAFGYLVSMSALMLGFIWAAVDADGLTWHDRMSRTLIVPAGH